MVEFRDPLPSGMKITIDDPEITYRLEEAIPGPPPPSEVRAIIGNLFFYHKESKEKVEFFRHPVSIELDIPEEILEEASQQHKGIEFIRFVYYDKKHERWLPFQFQTPAGEAKIIVRFNFWIKDPNVGWGLL